MIVARPLANGWLTDRPRNWFDVQDWQCEMWFSVGYKAEVDAMKRINKMIDDGVIDEAHLNPKRPDSFNRVYVHEIEPATPAGYFNYFIERAEIFERAYAQADTLFRKLKSDPDELEPGRRKVSRSATVALRKVDDETVRGIPASAGGV